MIVGLSGYARSGKDSVGNVLVQEFGYQRRAFADVMKAMALTLDPIVGESWRLKALVEACGWEVAKKNPEVRRFLQHLGTDAGRRHLGENVWVDALMNKLEPTVNYVITDCRFPNEAEGVKVRGGEVWRITRTGVEAANAHVSETALDDWDFDQLISNSGTLRNLRRKVHTAIIVSKILV